LASSERAQAMGLQASVRLGADESVSVKLGAESKTFAAPAEIRVTLSHPTRAGMDQVQTLALEGGAYRGRLKLPASGHWLLLIERPEATGHGWRLLGKVILPATEVKIGGVAP